MSYAVESVVIDPPGSAIVDVAPVQRLPLMYDTIKKIRAAGDAFVAQNKTFLALGGAPAVKTLFQIIDENGGVVGRKPA